MEEAIPGLLRARFLSYPKVCGMGEKVVYGAGTEGACMEKAE